jgi:hypothetical protein
MLAGAQPLPNLRNRIALLGDLRHRVPFEIVAKIAFAHYGLLASIGREEGDCIAMDNSDQKHVTFNYGF